MKRRQHGVSLIELMVAMVIAALLGIGIVQIFSGTRLAFSTNVALARAQENARFALDFLNRDLRMTGHLGTRNEQGGPGGMPEDPVTNLLFNHMAAATGANARRPSSAAWVHRLDLPFQAFDYTGTGMGSTVNIIDPPQLASNIGEWSPALPADLNVLFSGTGSGGNTGRVLINSDILVIRYLSAEFVTLVNGRKRSDGYPISTTTPFDAGTGQFTWSNETFPGFVQPNGIYAFSNARAVSLFQAGASSTSGVETTSIATGNLDWISTRPIGEDGVNIENPADYGSLLPVHRYELVVYYVGMGADGSPALFRRRLAADGLNIGPAEEMVPGVESLQVVMGAITTFPRPADQPTVYATADTIDACGFGGSSDACWRSVVNARVGLLMRSDQFGIVNATGTYNVSGANFSTNPGDRRLRFVYETQVSFRNRSRG